MTDTIDTHISAHQWNALSAQLENKLGALSPLASTKKHDGGAKLERTFVPGSSSSVLSVIINHLTDPQVVNGLSFILRDCVIDLAVYYPADGSLTSTLSLSEEYQTLRVQCPAPIDQVLELLQSQLGEANSEASSIELELPVLAAWLYWTFIDLQHDAMTDDGVLPNIYFPLDVIMTVLGKPVELLNNLSAYYRHALDLDIPLKKDVQSALRILTSKGLIESSEAGFKPGSLICEQALEFSELGAHLILKTNVLLPDGRIGTLRNFILQGKAGNGLLWFNNLGKINFIGLSPAQIIHLVEKIIKEPLHLFGKMLDRSPMSENKTMQKVPRRPPPPEKLS